MKAKVGPIEAEITEEDYAAIQKVSKVGIFQMISDQFGYWRQLNLMRIAKKFKKREILIQDRSAQNFSHSL